MSNDVVIDPKLLEGLGRRHETVPPERPSYLTKSQGIIKPNEPPKHFEFGVDLKVPKN